MKRPEVVLHLDRRIPGDVASDLGTRKAQPSKTENSEVILSGNMYGELHDISVLSYLDSHSLFSRYPNRATHPHLSVSATSVCLIWGAQKLWPIVDRGTTRLGSRVQKCSAGRAATRGVIVSTGSQWLLLVYEPHGRGVRNSAFPVCLSTPENLVRALLVTRKSTSLSVRINKRRPHCVQHV